MAMEVAGTENCWRNSPAMRLISPRCWPVARSLGLGEGLEWGEVDGCCGSGAEELLEAVGE